MDQVFHTLWNTKWDDGPPIGGGFNEYVSQWIQIHTIVISKVQVQSTLPQGLWDI